MRRAARGDGEAFEELYRRHGQVAWRFAQAVAADRDAAVHAVAEGFGRALRGLRRYSRMDAEGFRPFVLAAIYRAAVDNLHAHGAPTPVAPVERSGARGRAARARAADAAFVEAAFRSLPERWRAAIWLSEVEAMPEDRIAPVLGVSAAVAKQLVARSNRGLAGRFQQGQRPVPDHLDSALRPMSDATPAGLGKAVGERWAALVSDPTARFAPISAWMSDRAVRPLWVSVGGLLGLGLIGLGIVGQNTGVNSGPVASGGVPGSVNYPGINPALNRNFAPISGGSGLNPFNLSSASGGAGSGTPGGGFFGSTFPGSGGSGPLPPNGGTPTGPTVPTNPTPQLPITTPTLPLPSPSPSPTLPSNPLVSTSTSGSTTNVNVLPTSSGSTATVSVGCSTGVGLTIGTTSIGCTPTGTSQTSSPTTTSSVSSTLNTVTGLTSGL